MPYYDNFSQVYDGLMSDIDYAGQSEKIIKLFEKYDRKPSLLLDLACGTGGFSFQMAKKHIDVIGVDCSEGMLAVAENKKTVSDNPLFLCQYAEQLDLFGTVDGAICMLDSLNHITEYSDFCKAVARVSLFLEKDRLFIFDVNTVYKHRKVLDCNTFVKESEDAFCVWQNFRDGNRVDISLDIFVKTAGNEYTRIYEDFSERAYSSALLNRAIEKAGLKTVAILDKDGGEPQKASQRLIYITRKI